MGTGAKHGLDFVDAIALLESDDLLVIDDNRQDYGEQRCIGFGPVGGRICVVVHVRHRVDTARIISFRKANRREVKFYEASIPR